MQLIVVCVIRRLNTEISHKQKAIFILKGDVCQFDEFVSFLKRLLINIRKHFSSYLFFKGQNIDNCSLQYVYFDSTACMVFVDPLIVWRIAKRAIRSVFICPSLYLIAGEGAESLHRLRQIIYKISLSVDVVLGLCELSTPNISTSLK